jgi:hypothetical protein
MNTFYRKSLYGVKQKSRQPKENGQNNLLVKPRSMRSPIIELQDPFTVEGLRAGLSGTRPGLRMMVALPLLVSELKAQTRAFLVQFPEEWRGWIEEIFELSASENTDPFDVVEDVRDRVGQSILSIWPSLDQRNFLHELFNELNSFEAFRFGEHVLQTKPNHQIPPQLLFSTEDHYGRFHSK